MVITQQFFSGVNETTGFILALAAFAAGFAEGRRTVEMEVAAERDALLAQVKALGYDTDMLRYTQHMATP